MKEQDGEEAADLRVRPLIVELVTDEEPGAAQDAESRCHQRYPSLAGCFRIVIESAPEG
jgi:hypothetical protein